MALFRYSDGELHDLLATAIRIRWPLEDLLIVTPCSSEPTLTERAPPEGPPDTPTGAVLAATRARLIYQERTTHAVLLRAIAVIIGLIAVTVLFFGRGLTAFVPIALAGVGVWIVARLVEVFTLGSTSIEFQRVETVDRLAQRIEGTASGVLRRIRVPDPSDFGMIASLVGGYGQSVA